MDPFPESAASNLWRHTLSQIPSQFGKLVYLANLRNPNSGRYEHHGLISYFGEEEADRTLRQSHEEVFAGWIERTLEQQQQDLEHYFENLPEADLPSSRKSLVESWIQVPPYPRFVPAGATLAERKLYEGDLDILLGLLKNEYGAAGVDEDA